MYYSIAVDRIGHAFPEIVALNGALRELPYLNKQKFDGWGLFEKWDHDLGRPIDLRNVPTKLLFKSKRKKLADALAIDGRKYVSRRFYEILQELEPGRHQMVRATVELKEDKSLHEYYFLNVCTRLDATDHERSTRVMGQFWYEVKPGELFFDPKKIGDHHLFVDKYRWGGLYASSQLIELIEKNKITGFAYSPRA